MSKDNVTLNINNHVLQNPTCSDMTTEPKKIKS